LQGLTFDDKNPFGAIIAARTYHGQYAKNNPELDQIMRDRQRENSLNPKADLQAKFKTLGMIFKGMKKEAIE